MTKIKSKLKETDFSRFNLRDAYITSYPEYAAALRDEALFSNYGIKALIKTPKIENNVDEYSNFVDDDFEVTTESIIPKFEQYRQNVSVEGMAADGTEGLYPLEVLIPTKLHLPKNSRIVLTEFNSKEFMIAREWTVLSTEMKQLSGSKTYSRVAYCVPARQSIHRTAEFEELYGIFYFDINKVIDKVVTNTIRAHTHFYFNIHPVSLRRTLNYEEIQEELITVYATVRTYADLLSYDTTDVPNNSLFVVSYDETKGGKETYYYWRNEQFILKKDIQEVPEQDTQYQENFYDDEEQHIKVLHVDSTGTATFVVKATAISVLY